MKFNTLKLIMSIVVIIIGIGISFFIGSWNAQVNNQKELIQQQHDQNITLEAYNKGVIDAVSEIAGRAARCDPQGFSLTFPGNQTIHLVALECYQGGKK